MVLLNLSLVIRFVEQSFCLIPSPSLRSGFITPHGSSDGSPVSTPGASPYNSCADLTQLNNEEATPSEPIMNSSNTQVSIPPLESNGLVHRAPASIRTGDVTPTGNQESTNRQIILHKGIKTYSQFLFADE